MANLHVERFVLEELSVLITRTPTLDIDGALFAFGRSVRKLIVDDPWSDWFTLTSRRPLPQTVRERRKR